MSLRFCDGFDHYNLVLQKWTFDPDNSTAFVTGRRTGSNAIRLTYQGPTKVLDSQRTWVIGFAFQTANLQLKPICTLSDNVGVQTSLYLNASGGLSVYRGNLAVLLGSSTNFLVTPNIWSYLEFKVFIDATTGTYAVRQGSVSILSGSGANTQGQTGNTADRVRIMSDTSGNQHLFDDLYMLDGAGSVNNDFLGDIAVRALYPTSNGTYAEWTPSAGSNFQNVDETPPNDDTDYNSTLTVGARDTFHLTTLAAGTVYGVQQIIRHRKDDAGSHTLAPMIRSGAADYVGTTVSVSDSYTDAVEVHETDPATSTAWTPTSINAAEFGYKDIS